MELIKIIGVAILAFFVGYLIGKIVKYSEIKKVRKDTAQRSRRVILGETAEKIAPFLPDIKYHPKDMVFVGKGVDYVVFDGLSGGNLNQIVFLEIKTGKSAQNKNEKQIQQIIKMKKVKYELKKINL